MNHAMNRTTSSNGCSFSKADFEEGTTSSPSSTKVQKDEDSLCKMSPQRFHKLLAFINLQEEYENEKYLGSTPTPVYTHTPRQERDPLQNRAETRRYRRSKTAGPGNHESTCASRERTCGNARTLDERTAETIPFRASRPAISPRVSLTRPRARPRARTLGPGPVRTALPIAQPKRSRPSEQARHLAPRLANETQGETES